MWRTLKQADEGQDALNLLNSRRRDVRPNSIAEEVEGSEVMPKRPSFRGKPSLLGMRTWLNCIGHSVLPLIMGVLLISF